MSFDQDDKTIVGLFQAEVLKSPPKVLLEELETDILREINAPGFHWGLMPFVLVSVVLLLVLGLGTWAVTRQLSVAPVVDGARGAPLAPLILESSTLEKSQISPSQQITETTSPEAVQDKEIDKLSDDLILLQMLGEDEGLADELGSLGSDLDMLSQTMPAPGAIS